MIILLKSFIDVSELTLDELTLDFIDKDAVEEKMGAPTPLRNLVCPLPFFS